MAGTMISDDGRTATINGQLVALEELPSQQQQQIRALAAAESAPATAGATVDGLGTYTMPNGAAWEPSMVEPSQLAGGADAGALTMEQRIAAAAPQGAPAPARPRFRTATNTNTSTRAVAGQDELSRRGNDLAERRQGLAIDQAQHQVEVSDARAEALTAEAIARDKASAEVAGIRQEGDAEAERHMMAAQELREQASELQAKGHNFWADKSAGNKITAVIGAMFGGAASAVNGGPNQFMQHINGLIAREDRLHQERIDGLRKDAKSEVGFYDVARTRTKDQVAQRLMAQNMMLDSVKAKLGAQVESLGESQAAIDMGMAISAIDEQQLANDQKLAPIIQTNTTKRLVAVKGGGGMGVGPDGKPIKNIPGTRISDEQAYAGLSNEERKVVRKLSGSANALYSTLDKMAKIREEYGTEAGDTQAQSDYVNLAQSAKVSISQMLDQGTITSSDAEQMQGLWEEDLSPRMSDAQRVAGVDPTLNKIRGAMKNVEAQGNHRLRAYGVTLEGLATPTKRIRGAQQGFK